VCVCVHRLEKIVFATFNSLQNKPSGIWSDEANLCFKESESATGGSEGGFKGEMIIRFQLVRIPLY